MQINLEKIKSDYDKWVEENLADFQAGNVQKAIKNYPFVESNDIPWTPFRGEPSKKTFALICSGGLYLKNSQPAFEPDSIHGDTSFREIPKSVQQEDLGIAHGRYDPELAEQDINGIFPIHRFLELEKDGHIGKVADTHYSFSYLNDVVTFIKETVPKVIEGLKNQAVDALFLVPV
jgi:D-proline reductase (dithiol) PrdB